MTNFSFSVSPRWRLYMNINYKRRCTINSSKLTYILISLSFLHMRNGRRNYGEDHCDGYTGEHRKLWFRCLLRQLGGLQYNKLHDYRRTNTRIFLMIFLGIYSHSTSRQIFPRWFLVDETPHISAQLQYIWRTKNAQYSIITLVSGEPCSEKEGVLRLSSTYRYIRYVLVKYVLSTYILPEDDYCS